MSRPFARYELPQTDWSVTINAARSCGVPQEDTDPDHTRIHPLIWCSLALAFIGAVLWWAWP